MKIPNLENEIIYNDFDHSYKRARDGKLLAGVSTVSSLAKDKNSDGFLAQWKVNECIEYIKANSKKVSLEGSPDFFYEVYDETLKDSKYAHKEKGKEATDIGTEFHNYLERYVKSRINHYQFADPIKNESLKEAFKTFQKWETENNVEWVASELLVGDAEKLELAGRLDALAIVNGVLTIIDFKVANTVTPNYYIQLAGYKVCLSAMGIEVKDSLIIRLPKSKKKKVWVEATRKYSMVDNIIEFITPPTNPEWDKEVFIKIREIYKWINYYYK
jgi:hypothetical protein